MGDNDPIRRVSVVSTGQVRIRPDHDPARPASDLGLAPFQAGHDLFGDGSLVILPAHDREPRAASPDRRRQDPDRKGQP